MRLTRRDAVVSLLAGVGAGAVGLSDLMNGRPAEEAESSELTDEQIRTLVAVAEVVYPSEVSGTGEFVREYVSGLPVERTASVASAAAGLDEYTRRERGVAFASLPASERDSVLRSLGVDRSGSSADGTLPERVRYYAVNQLLYGLYTSPTGSKLLGIENPVGYPGGYKSYQKPPTRTNTVDAHSSGGEQE
jgi:hypothetical protein